MSYRNAVLSLLTIAVLSIGVHELRSQARARAQANRSVAHSHRGPIEVRVVRVDRQLLGQMLTSDPRAAHRVLGLENRAIDVDRHQVLDVVDRLAPLARGVASEVVLSLHSRGRALSIVVIAESGDQRG